MFYQYGTVKMTPSQRSEISSYLFRKLRDMQNGIGERRSLTTPYEVLTQILSAGNRSLGFFEMLLCEPILTDDYFKTLIEGHDATIWLEGRKTGNTYWENRFGVKSHDTKTRYDCMVASFFNMLMSLELAGAIYDDYCSGSYDDICYGTDTVMRLQFLAKLYATHIAWHNMPLQRNMIPYYIVTGENNLSLDYVLKAMSVMSYFDVLYKVETSFKPISHTFMWYADDIYPTDKKDREEIVSNISGFIEHHRRKNRLVGGLVRIGTVYPDLHFVSFVMDCCSSPVKITADRMLVLDSDPKKNTPLETIRKDGELLTDWITRSVTSLGYSGRVVSEPKALFSTASRLLLENEEFALSCYEERLQDYKEYEKHWKDANSITH